MYINIQQPLYFTQFLLIILQFFRYQLHRRSHFFLPTVLRYLVTSPESNNDTCRHNAELTKIVSQFPAFEHVLYLIPTVLSDNSDYSK